MKRFFNRKKKEPLPQPDPMGRRKLTKEEQLANDKIYQDYVDNLMEKSGISPSKKDTVSTSSSPQDDRMTVLFRGT
jgi:hypothetical protein